LGAKIYGICSFFIFTEFGIKTINITRILPLIIAWGVIIAGILSRFINFDFQNMLIFCGTSNLLKLLQKNEAKELKKKSTRIMPIKRLA